MKAMAGRPYSSAPRTVRSSFLYGSRSQEKTTDLMDPVYLTYLRYGIVLFDPTTNLPYYQRNLNCILLQRERTG